MADPNTKINSSVGGPESATAQSSNAGEKGTSAGKGLAGDTGGMLSSLDVVKDRTSFKIEPESDQLIRCLSWQPEPGTGNNTWGFRTNRGQDRRHQGLDRRRDEQLLRPDRQQRW